MGLDTRCDGDAMIILVLYYAAHLAGIAPHPMPTACLFFLAWELTVEIVIFVWVTVKGLGDLWA